MFSQFFKEPLFSESAIDRELNAVDNEHKMLMSDEFRRTYQIEKSHLAVPGSLLDRFTTGSLETLNIPNIRQELIKFHENNYSSNLMNLVLVSRLGLDELQDYAVENFNQIQNKELPVKDFSKEVVFDKDHTFGRICKIIPDKLVKQLSLRWITPASPIQDTKKSSRYISHVLAHEGPNSLLS